MSVSTTRRVCRCPLSRLSGYQSTLSERYVTTDKSKYEVYVKARPVAKDLDLQTAINTGFNIRIAMDLGDALNAKDYYGNSYFAYSYEDPANEDRVFDIEIRDISHGGIVSQRKTGNQVDFDYIPQADYKGKATIRYRVSLWGVWSEEKTITIETKANLTAHDSISGLAALNIGDTEEKTYELKRGVSTGSLRYERSETVDASKVEFKDWSESTGGITTRAPAERVAPLPNPKKRVSPMSVIKASARLRSRLLPNCQALVG